MVHTHIGDFTQDVPESSNARARATTNERHNAAHRTPPPPLPPPPPVSLEQLLATQNELMRVLMENLVQREVRPPAPPPTRGGDFLHRLPSDAPFTSLSSSLGFYTSLRSRRPCSQPSSIVDLQVLGGLTSPPPFRTATRCHGPNSAWLFVGTTSLQA
jgi:hypothetical protein